MSTLSIADIVQISVTVSPTSATGRDFDLGLIVGTSAVIAGTTIDRLRLYSNTNAMISDGFTDTSPEYLAAQLYFSQSPKPSQVAVGRWNSSTESALAAVQACRVANIDWYGLAVCGAVADDLQMIAAYVESMNPSGALFGTTADAAVLANTAVVSGYETGGATPTTTLTSTETTLQIAVDADAYGITPTYQPVTLTNPTSLTTGAEIAAALQAAIQALGNQYAAVTVTYGTTYIVTSASKGPLSKVRIISGSSDDMAAVLKLGAANGAVDTDGLGSVLLALQGASYAHTLTQYSTQTPNAAVAPEGYAMGANTGAPDSAFCLASRVMVGVTAETLTETQAAAILGANGNFVASYGNTYTLLQTGVMASGAFFDQTLGLDQLASQIQTAVMNLLIQPPKVPQTEGGMTQLRSAIKGPCENAVETGFLAPGVWTGPPVTVGSTTLKTGDTLSEGYLVLSETIASQKANSMANYTARKSPPIYVLVSLAGAIQTVVIAVYVQQ